MPTGQSKGGWDSASVNETDRKWLERGLREAVLDGDERAWTALYESCFERLFAHVYHRVERNRQRAEEVVQDAWLIAVRRIKHFDPERGAFECWMRGIAENVLRNQRRRWWRRERTEVALEQDASGLVPQEALATTEQVTMAMAVIPPRYQGVLRAKYEEQLPVTEIAARSNTTPKAVESLLSRARAAFREAYVDLEKGR